MIHSKEKKKKNGIGMIIDEKFKENVVETKIR